MTEPDGPLRNGSFPSQFPGRSVYPAVYRREGVWFYGTLIFGLLFLSLGSYLFFFLSQVYASELSRSPPAWVVCLSLPILGIILISAAFRERFIILQDSIESHGTFRTRRLKRSLISGKRITKGRFGLGDTIFIFPIESKIPVLKIEVVFKPDRTFIEWVDAIPDLGSDDNLKTVFEVLIRR